MTKKTFLIAAVLTAVVGLTFGFTTTASAFSASSYPAGYTSACTCHGPAATNPVATLNSNNGTTAMYTVSSGGTEWAVFNGVTRLAWHLGDGGQFSVPVGGTYTLYAVLGDPLVHSSQQGLGKTTVIPVAPHFTITATAGSNGSISPAGSLSATKGADVTYTFTPDTGYHVAAVTVDSAPVGGVASYTFTNVQIAHTIAVTFAPGAVSTYKITATAGDHGGINPAGDKQLAAGGSIVYTMQPAQGYRVATITVDGVSLPPTSTAGSAICSQGWYTFLNVVEPHTISVTFKLNLAGWFTVTPYAGEHGQIWMAQQTVLASDTAPAIVSCSIIPDAGYHVATLIVDGAPVTPATWYNFSNVRAGHSIAATFALDLLHFNITATAGAHGAISHAGSMVCTQGTDVTYTFTPDSGYHVATVTVGGSSVAVASSYTFTNLQAAQTIAVTFEADPPLHFTIAASAGANGGVSPVGSLSATQGTDVTYTFTPSSGYHVAAVTVDGSSVAVASSYTFTNVQAVHTIAVTFSRSAKISTALSFKSSPYTSYRGHKFVFTGKISPSSMRTGTRITIWIRKSGQAWRKLGTVYTNMYDNYSYTLYNGSRAHGKYYVRSKYAGNSVYASCYSPYKTVYIK